MRASAFEGVPDTNIAESDGKWVRLNNDAVVELTYSLLPSLMEHPQAGIINVSSAAGFQPVSLCQPVFSDEIVSKQISLWGFRKNSDRAE